MIVASGVFRAGAGVGWSRGDQVRVGVYLEEGSADGSLGRG